MINDPSDASIIERLHSVIVEKRHSKVLRRVVLLHANASIDMFTLLFDTSEPILSTYSHPLSNLRSKNLNSDDEAVDDYFTDLNLEFFFD